MLESLSSAQSIAVVFNLLFAVGVLFYGLMRRSERLNVAFANLPSAFLIIFIPNFADHVWYWFVSYPAVFMILFIFSKKFMDLSAVEKNVGDLTLKEFFSLLRLRKKSYDVLSIRHFQKLLPIFENFDTSLTCIVLIQIK